MPGRIVDVISVNSGRPAPLTRRRGSVVLSAIHKRPVSAATRALSSINLEGDDQADRTVHGGRDKALYVYPVEHLRSWAAEHPDHADVFTPGGIGENLTVEGWLEDAVRIGDTWRWGDALIQVSQPRSPCYKLAARSGIPALTRLFEQTGRSGWYMRVLQAAPAVPTAPSLRLEVVERGPASLTVANATRLLRGDGEPAELAHAAADPALAAAWRREIGRRLAIAIERESA